MGHKGVVLEFVPPVKDEIPHRTVWPPLILTVALMLPALFLYSVAEPWLLMAYMGVIFYLLCATVANLAFPLEKTR